MKVRVDILVTAAALGLALALSSCARKGPPIETKTAASAETAAAEPASASAAEPESEPPPPVDSVSEREIARLIDLYKGCHWDAYFLPSGFGFDRLSLAMALVARRRLEQHPDAAVDAIVERLLHGRFVSGGDGGAPESAPVFELLQSMGTRGVKAGLGLDCEYTPDGRYLVYRWRGPLLSANDETWFEWARRELPDADPTHYGWELAHDSAALAGLEGYIDSTIELYDPSLASTEWVDPAQYLRDVLAMAPADGGVTDAKLREWSQARGINLNGVRWGADLALARRGHEAAQQRSRETLSSRFAPLPQEADELQGHTSRGELWDAAQFQFVLELADAPLKDRWDLLLDLLKDARAELLAPRAAAILAFEEHWQDVDAATQETVRGTMGEVCRGEEEENEWLRSLLISFLASHPRPH